MDKEKLLETISTLPRQEGEKLLIREYFGHMITYTWMDYATEKEKAKSPPGIRTLPFRTRTLTGMCNSITYWDGRVIAQIRDKRIEAELEGFIENTIIHGTSHTRD